MGKSMFDGHLGVPRLGSPSRRTALNKLYQAKSRKKKMMGEELQRNGQSSPARTSPPRSSPANPSSSCLQEQVSKEGQVGVASSSVGVQGRPVSEVASPAAATIQRVEMASQECEKNFGNASATSGVAMVDQECQTATRKPEMVSQECQTVLTGQFISSTNEELVHEVYALRTRFKCNVPRHLLHKY